MSEELPPLLVLNTREPVQRFVEAVSHLPWIREGGIEAFMSDAVAQLGELDQLEAWVEQWLGEVYSSTELRYGQDCAEQLVEAALGLVYHVQMVLQALGAWDSGGCFWYRFRYMLAHDAVLERIEPFVG